jgi:hypothetical protein
MDATDWDAERQKAAEVAKNLCEGCRPKHYLPYPFGQLHHRQGRGGGRREDRIFLPMQTLETEPNLARWRWCRNLIWVCAVAHDRLERENSKDARRSAKKFCTCGLLLFR